MVRVRLLAAASLLMTAAAASAQSPSSPPPPPPQPVTAATPFMQLAGESDVYEITSSQIALMRSQDPDVRRFASMLIDHHTRTTNALLLQAKTAGLTPPPAVLGPRTREQIDRLLSVQGSSFDREYLTQQVPAHEQALAIHSTYAERGDIPELRTAAAGAAPIVTQHLDEARRLGAQRGG